MERIQNSLLCVAWSPVFKSFLMLSVQLLVQSSLWPTAWLLLLNTELLYKEPWHDRAASDITVKAELSTSHSPYRYAAQTLSLNALVELTELIYYRGLGDEHPSFFHFVQSYEWDVKAMITWQRWEKQPSCEYLFNRSLSRKQTLALT